MTDRKRHRPQANMFLAMASPDVLPVSMCTPHVPLGAQFLATLRVFLHRFQHCRMGKATQMIVCRWRSHSETANLLQPRPLHDTQDRLSQGPSQLSAPMHVKAWLRPWGAMRRVRLAGRQ
jgi:hypothetical protein